MAQKNPSYLVSVSVYHIYMIYIYIYIFKAFDELLEVESSIVPALTHPDSFSILLERASLLWLQ
jgi:hypothetical protein